MLNIVEILQVTDLKNQTLRERAERGHCGRSKEFVAYQDGEEVGFLSYEKWSNKMPGFVYEIFVLAPFRRQGVGRSLLSYAEDYAFRLGCKSIRLKPYPLCSDFKQSELLDWYIREGYCQIPGDLEHVVKTLHR